MLTNAQVDLLKRLIEADRLYHSKKAAGQLVHRDDRGVEVCPVITGVYRRTAEALVKAGLAEYLDTGRKNGSVYLKSYDPYDPVEE